LNKSKNKRILVRRRLEKNERKRIERNEIRKKLRQFNEMYANLAVHKMKTGKQ
jgi:hypothetical protein